MIRFIFIILVFASSLVFSQENTKTGFPQSIEIQAGYGYIAKHSDIVDYYITGHVPNFNLIVGKQVSGNKEWHKLYNFPEIGFGLYHANLNNEYLGTATALYSYINLPFSKKEKKLKPIFIFSVGVTYVSLPFDMETNYQNRIIGSHINLFIKAGLGLEYKLTNKLKLSSSIALNHYSNAKTHIPNLGINVTNINLGLKYNMYESKTFYKDFETNIANKNEYLLVLSAGVKGTNKPLSPRYLGSSFVFDYSRIITQKSKFGAGSDIFYDGTLEYYYNNDTTVTYNSKADNMLAGVHLSYALVFNKISYNLQLGYYLYDKLNINGNIYSRLGFRTYITDKIILNLTLKTHFAKADLLEFGVGYRIN